MRAKKTVSFEIHFLQAYLKERKPSQIKTFAHRSTYIMILFNFIHIYRFEKSLFSQFPVTESLHYPLHVQNKKTQNNLPFSYHMFRMSNYNTVYE